MPHDGADQVLPRILAVGNDSRGRFTSEHAAQLLGQSPPQRTIIRGRVIRESRGRILPTAEYR
jgi:hypothetical protein